MSFRINTAIVFMLGLSVMNGAAAEEVLLAEMDFSKFGGERPAARSLVVEQGTLEGQALRLNQALRLSWDENGVSRIGVESQPGFAGLALPLTKSDLPDGHSRLIFEAVVRTDATSRGSGIQMGFANNSDGALQNSSICLVKIDREGLSQESMRMSVFGEAGAGKALADQVVFELDPEQSVLVRLEWNVDTNAVSVSLPEKNESSTQISASLPGTAGELAAAVFDIRSVQDGESSQVQSIRVLSAP